jgi:hypothetical protein
MCHVSRYLVLLLCQERLREKTTHAKEKKQNRNQENFKRGNRDHTPEKTPVRVYANASKTKEKNRQEQERES